MNKISCDALAMASPIRNNSDTMEDVMRTNEELDDLFNDDQVTSQQPLDYETFLPGFSDDEDGEEAFNRSWPAQQARKKSPKSKKSPRHSETSDGYDEASPHSKRPRKSLFGGPDEEMQDQEQEENKRNEEMGNLQIARPDMRQRFSSLNLEQQDAQDVQDTQNIQEAEDGGHFDTGFDLGGSAMDGMSQVPSRAPSEESIVIPPDTMVSVFTPYFSVTSAHITSQSTNCAKTSIERKRSHT
jgi:hypothetical protein